MRRCIISTQCGPTNLEGLKVWALMGITYIYTYTYTHSEGRLQIRGPYLVLMIWPLELRLDASSLEKGSAQQPDHWDKYLSKYCA